MIGRPWARLLGSVRVRVTLLAAGAFAVTLAVASTLLLRALENRLEGDVRRSAVATLRAEADNLAGRPIGADAQQIETRAGRVFARQLPNGLTLFVSAGATDSEPDVVIPPGAAETPVNPARVPVRELYDVADLSGPQMVTSVGYGPVVLSMASPLDQVQATLDTTGRLLWLVGPLLVVLVAAMAWLLAGRALRPVHAITSRVSSIGSKSLHDRVPVPESGDEIAELAEMMNQMLARLESAANTNRRLVSDASHELRTPVAVMRTELEVARRAADNDWSATGAVLISELDRLQGLVDDLLLLARGDERALATEELDLPDVVHVVAGRRRRVGVEAKPGPDSLVVQGDRQALVRALDHLAANAARSADHRVTIRVEPNGSEVAVHVDDDGPGIPEDQREAVVQRFVRLDEGRARDEGGAGLGLAVAADVAAAHGGRLVIDDSPLGGARVSIVLPTANSASEV